MAGAARTSIGPIQYGTSAGRIRDAGGNFGLIGRHSTDAQVRHDAGWELEVLRRDLSVCGHALAGSRLILRIPRHERRHPPVDSQHLGHDRHD